MLPGGPAPDGAAGTTGSSPYDGLGDSLAQAEISQYIAQSAARKKRKRMLFAASGVLALAGAGLYAFSSAQLEKRKVAAAEFLSAFLAVDDGPIADYWRCAVHAKREDVHRAKDNLVITSRLEQAFEANPEKQPSHLRGTCLPKLTSAKAAFDQLSAPGEFDSPLQHVKAQVSAMQDSMERYIAKLDRAKHVAANEQKIVEAGSAFHDPSGLEAAKAAGYVSLLRCAIPNLGQLVRLVRQPPDTQGVVEHVYTTCKADPSYANTLRLKCISELSDPAETKLYALARRRMSGDSRDLSAIKHCFSSVNSDLFRDELGKVGRAFVEYRNAVKRVVNQVAHYKDEEAATGEDNST